MKISVFTLGCKVNRSESDSIIEQLRADGHEVYDGLKPADLFIVNTCAVTSEAEKKSRQLSARISAISPDAKVIFIGCASEHNPESFYKKDNAQLVMGTFNKGEVHNLLAIDGVMVAPHHKEFEELYPAVSSRTRTYVKIQDGCNNFCSYCLIPYLRGRSRSRAPENIIKEIENLSPLECVLNGINISDYHYDGVDLAGLIDRLSAIDTRIRLGSIEVNVIDDKLLRALKNLKNFAPHFHLSLQSGSDLVLKKMNRHYTSKEYFEKVQLIRKYFPKAGITTDVIVGFPTETDEEFKASYDFIKSVKFSDIHPFSYSKRGGTVASKLTEVEKSIKRERLEKMLKLKEEVKENFVKENLGDTLNLLTEEVVDGYFAGYTENYLRVYVKADDLKGGEFVKVKIVGALFDGALGEIIK